MADTVQSSGKTRTWEQYQAGISYRDTMGFSKDFPMFEDFKEGKQWSKPTERTKSLPRPVFNIIDMFIRTKRSAVVNQPITITYTPAEVSSDEMQRSLAVNGAKDMTDYCKQLWESLDQDGLNEDMVDDGATLGTGILHYYFDPSVTGGMEQAFIGEIRGEVIDPLNIVFANPQCRDEQKQQYIIIAQRVPVSEVRAMAEKEGIPAEQLALINEDRNTSTEGYASAQHEIKGEEKLTLLTKYYRRDGVVYFDKCTEAVEIIKERCLSPTIEGQTGYRIKLYPIVVFPWRKRKKCIFGIGECQNLIPAQKAVNFLKAMELLSIQQTAWPKLKVKPGALHQQLTNEPGEVVIDHYGNGSGIEYMNPPVLTGAASNLAASIFDLMRTTSGVSEVSTGEPIGASISASAIIALQSQARTPIEEVQKRYWKCVRRVGAIWAELIKAYYSFERNITVDEPNAENDADNTRPFTGSAYAGIDFRMKIDVGASSEYGEVLAQATLDMMLQRGDITIDEYVELAPHNVVPFAEDFKRLRKESGKAQQELLMQAMAQQEAMQGAMPTGDSAQIPQGASPLEHPAGVGGANLPAIPHAPGI